MACVGHVVDLACFTEKTMGMHTLMLLFLDIIALTTDRSVYIALCIERVPSSWIHRLSELNEGTSPPYSRLLIGSFLGLIQILASMLHTIVFRLLEIYGFPVVPGVSDHASTSELHE